MNEQILLKSLQHAANKIPKGYWLFAASGSLWLMRPGADGQRATNHEGGMDQSYCVGKINCSCDGGDW